MERAASDIGRDSDRDRGFQQRPLTRRSTDMQPWPSPATERSVAAAATSDPSGPSRWSSRLLHFLDSIGENQSQVHGGTVTEQGGRGADVSSNSGLKRAFGITDIAAACDRTERVPDRASSTESGGRQRHQQRSNIVSDHAGSQFKPHLPTIPRVTRNRAAGSTVVPERDSRSLIAAHVAKKDQRRPNEATAWADKRILATKIASYDGASMPSRVGLAARQPNGGRTAEIRTSEESVSMKSGTRQQSSGANGKIGVSDADWLEHQSNLRLGARLKTNQRAAITPSDTGSRIPRITLRQPSVQSSVGEERIIEDQIGDADSFDEFASDEDSVNELIRYLETNPTKTPPASTQSTLRQTASVATIRPPEVAMTMLRGSESDANAPNARTNDSMRSRRQAGDVAEQRRQMQSSGDGLDDDYRRRMQSRGHRNFQHKHPEDSAYDVSDEFTPPRPTQTRLSSDRDLDRTLVDPGRLYRPPLTTGQDTNRNFTLNPVKEVVNSSAYNREPHIFSSSIASPTATRKSVHFDASGSGCSHRRAPVDDRHRRSMVDPSHTSARQEERRATRSRDLPRRERQTQGMLTPRDAGRIAFSFASRVGSMLFRLVTFLVMTCLPHCYDELVTHALPQAFSPITQEPAFVEVGRFVRRWYVIVTDNWASFFDFVVGVLVFCFLLYVLYKFVGIL